MDNIIESGNYLFIGDIHGRYDLFKKAVDYGRSNSLTIIVVGDYVDSFKTDSPDDVERHKIKRDQFKCLELARGLNEQGHHCLIGNHELSYLDSSFRCPGYQQKIAPALMHKIKDANLKNYVIIRTSSGDDILVTHAGLTKKFVNQLWGETSNLSVKLDQQLASYRNPIYERGDPQYLDIGIRKVYGGIFWCRPWEFEPLDGYRQVFGHTNTNIAYSKAGGIHVIEGRHNIKWRNINIDNFVDEESVPKELLVYYDGTDEFKFIPKDKWLNK